MEWVGHGVGSILSLLPSPPHPREQLWLWKVEAAGTPPVTHVRERLSADQVQVRADGAGLGAGLPAEPRPLGGAESRASEP
jgi:hypothetical protein